MAAGLAIPEIPSEFSYLLPSKQLTVAQLLVFDLSAQSSSLVPPHLEGAISDLPPTETLEKSAQRKIPAANYIGAAKKAFENVISHGDGCARSIKDRAAKGVRSTLSVITFWTEASAALHVQQIWKEADAWVSNVKKMPHYSGRTEAIDDTRALLRKLQWATRLRVFKGVGAVDVLATLLSDQPLNDDILNLLITHLADCARGHRELSKVVLASTYFVASLQSTYGKGIQKDLDLRRLTTATILPVQQLFVDKSHEALFCVVNVANRHWILIKVDFATRILAYGKLSAINIIVTH